MNFIAGQALVSQIPMVLSQGGHVAYDHSRNEICLISPQSDWYSSFNDKERVKFLEEVAPTLSKTESGSKKAGTFKVVWR